MADSVISERDGKPFLTEFPELVWPKSLKMSGLTNPKDFLLNLGETLTTKLHCQITTCNHDAEGPHVHGRRE
jgi:hypothetical protein